MARVVSKEESRLVLNADGEWVHDGVTATHAGVTGFFNGQIRRDDNGDYYLYNAIDVPEKGITLEEHVYFQVEDTPWFVRNVAWDVSAGAFVATLTDDTRHTVAAGDLEARADGTLVCHLPGGERARFTRGAMTAIAKHLESDDQGYFLQAGDFRVRIR